MSNLMIGISGVRGIVGEGLTPIVAARFGWAFATLLNGGKVAVGRDTRPSGEMVKSAVVAGLLAGGAEVVDLGVASTPATALMTRRLNCDGGIVVTASHNSAPWNGMKFLRPTGVALSPEAAKRLRDVYDSESFRVVGAENMKAVSADDRAADMHVQAVLDVVDRSVVARKGYKVVLDSVNGAGSEEGRKLLQSFKCDAFALACVPDGRFPHPPEPTAENLRGLCDAVVRKKADVGFAQDPDADRLAVVDEKGRYVGEEYTLALAAKFVLRARRGALAANLSTSRMIDRIAEEYGCTVHRTPVGEVNVADAIVRHHCILGGEGNGGVIEPRVVLVRDSLSAMAFILQLMAETGRPLSQLVDEIPRYFMVKTKFDCAPERSGRIIDAIKARYADRPQNTSDGVRVEFDDAWVHVRPSNTEPIFRVIGEAAQEETARSLCEKVAAEAAEA